ncbi:MAG: hypothetical protein QOK31_1668 [Solirubrobacteraceae bacterium]|nr:hypothetical protein [Solirubrobacteraceae bacterium]
MQVTSDGLTPAEHRSLRELYAAARHVAGHWATLAEQLDGEARDALRIGAAVARELGRELRGRTAPHGLHGQVAAQSVGARVAGLRNGAGDLFLERAQALRLAVLDVQHVTTLLAFLERLASARGDDELAAFHRSWGRKLERSERDVRATAIAAGEDPDGAVAPLRSSPLGRAAHGMAYAVGTAGEWVDRRLARSR